MTEELKKYKKFVQKELNQLMESMAFEVAEHQRIMSKKEMDDFEKGRLQGMILLLKDTFDNLNAFAYHIGIDTWEDLKDEH